MLRLVAACPTSCVLCTKDATLCQQLPYVIAAPVTTRLLIITDGHLSSVESTNLSLLFNLALLSLSRNKIKNIEQEALNGLTQLQTLLLGHNQISSSSLPDDTFSELHSLQVLVLSHNALRTLRGSWFRNTRFLTRLQLDGNQITNLTDSSFAGTSLHNLRHLDLSNNFISYIEREALKPLPQLQEVDLSRNRLTQMPDIFTPLKQLILLSLDKNQWSCTCDLHPLARFLRNYISSSTHMLTNARDLNCQVTAAATAITRNLLKLSETNCDPKAPNLTLVLKDRRPFLPGQDVALLTILGFAGAVGLTCLGLVVFNWKLQQGKSNEHTSENLCCRTFDESLCAHEARNYYAKGDCNCHLTQESEIKVMSIVGSRKEMPLSQENSHQATLSSESTALDGSFRNLKGKDHGADSTFFCLDGRLLQTGCSEPPGMMAAFNEAGVVTRCCPNRVENFRECETRKVQAETLPQHVTRTMGICSDTFRRRYATSASFLATESHEKYSTNESWQSPTEKEDNGLQPHRQRHFIPSLSSKPCEPEECCLQSILQKQRSKHDEPYRLLEQSRPRHFQLNNSLTCKYVPYGQFQDYVKERKRNHREHLKSEKEQIQINNAIEKFLMREDSRDISGISTKIKKMHSPKRVTFHNPDLAEKDMSAMMPKTSNYWKLQENQSNHWINLELKKHSSLGEKNKGEKWFSDSQILTRKRTGQTDLKRKSKGQDLRMKLNLHPFRKVKVHPEKSLLDFQKKHIVLLPKKLSKTSEKKAKIDFISTTGFPQVQEKNSRVRLTSKRLVLKHAPKQNSYYKRNTRNVPVLVANPRSVDGSRHPAVRVPEGSCSPLPQPLTSGAVCTSPLSQLSAEQSKCVNQLDLEVPGFLHSNQEHIGSYVLSLQHSRRAIDQGATTLPEHTGQEKSKTSELSQDFLSSKTQPQPPDIHLAETYIEKHVSGQSQVLKQEKQNSNYDPLGHEEKTLEAKPKLSLQIVEHCIMDTEGNDRAEHLPNTETYDSSLIPLTQSKNTLPLMKTNSVLIQNGKELPNDIDTFPPSSPAVWHLANSSDKGPASAKALPGDDSSETLETNTAGKEA